MIATFTCRRFDSEFVEDLREIATSSFVSYLRVIATFLICRRLAGDDVPHLEELSVIATFLICRRLEGDSYVPHLSRT